MDRATAAAAAAACVGEDDNASSYCWGRDMLRVFARVDLTCRVDPLDAEDSSVSEATFVPLCQTPSMKLIVRKRPGSSTNGSLLRAMKCFSAAA